MAHNLALLNYGEIRVTPDERYSVFDVVQVIGGKNNPRKAWSDFCKQYPEIEEYVGYHKFPGRGQKITPVAKEDVCIEILKRIQTPDNIFGLWECSDRFYPRTEIQIVKVLEAAFCDCIPCPQFFVHGYRIDLYLARVRIAIECDESNHLHYNPTTEKHREKIIKAALGCSFVRFNPYLPSFNLGDVIFQVRQLIA